MIKFMVVCYRRPDWSRDQFRRYFRETHGPLAMAMPGLRGYVRTSSCQRSGGILPGMPSLNSGSTTGNRWKPPGNPRRGS